MNGISEQLLRAIDIIADEKVAQLQFDKTIRATIFSIVNLDTGEYKVRYSGNIFSAFSNDLNKTYKIDDAVYVVVPQGNFSSQKMIVGLVSAQSLSYNQLATLQNSIFEVSPEFNALYGGLIYDPEASYGVIAGRPVEQDGSYEYIYNGPNEFNANDFHGLFQQYANNYDLIRIQANFKTSFYNVHTKGNYGLEVEFYTKGNDIVSYRLDLNAFNGDPYCLNVYSQQSIIIKVQKNYLLGLKSIKLFEEDFVYDRLVENGVVTDKYNTTQPNIFVKDISLQYVEQKDLTDTSYYLMISAPKGIAFTSNISSLDLIGRLVYQGKDIIDESNCKLQWFVRDLTVMIGSEEYNKEAGFGWRQLPQTARILSLDVSDVLHQQKYKLLVTYNQTVSLSSEIEIFNHNSHYNYSIEQITDNADIYLQLTNNLGDEDLVGDWYLSYPDGSYIELTEEKKKNFVLVSSYLKYSSVTFYSQVYDTTKTNIIGTIEHTILNSESEEDVTISYNGEDTFRYDANGDITVEDSEKERTLQVNLTWKEGFGTAYTVEWFMKDKTGKDIPVPTSKNSGPPLSMIDSLWVDNSNILHYNIKQKYKVDYNNNTLVVKIKTISEQEYRFDKEILFLKDGDQGTNGTTYVLAVRPCDESGQKLSGFQPLIYNNGWQNTLNLRCYVYKDGEFINSNSKYDIFYKWEGVNIGFAEIDPTDCVEARGLVELEPTSAAKDLQAYVKVQVDINDKMNNRKVSIYSSYPIDIIFGDVDISSIDISTIPSYIKYSASGITPRFYNNNIMFFYNSENRSSSIIPMTPNILDKQEDNGLYYLKPASSFIAENIKNPDQSNVGVLKCHITDNQFVIHSVITYLDTYGNEAINGWNGEGIDRVEDGIKSYILAPQIGAGEKDSQNRFTGVVMGKDTARDKIGLYGYQKGINTFGLMEDGVAYFGAKSGGGQIVVDGTQAHIYGGGQYPAGSDKEQVGGNAENGMSIYLANLNPSKPQDQYAIKIAKGIFNVMYDGSLTATSADITGIIEAKEGYIGCSGRRTKDGWHIETNRISSGSGNNTVALDSSADSYFRIWAGASSPGTAYNASLSADKKITSPAKFVVTKDGFVYMRDCFIKGRLEASEGKIGGWTILNNRLVSDGKKIGLASNGTYRFWANADIGGDITDTPIFTGGSYFYVKSNGEMSCKNANIRGTVYAEKGTIGGWYINNNRLENSDGSVYISPSNLEFGSNFSVSSSGYLSCSSGSIGGWTITNNKLYSGNTTLNSNGIISTDYFVINNQGVIGHKQGWLSGAVGISSYESIILEAERNITLTADGNIWFEPSGSGSSRAMVGFNDADLVNVGSINGQEVVTPNSVKDIVRDIVDGMGYLTRSEANGLYASIGHSHGSSGGDSGDKS